MNSISHELIAIIYTLKIASELLFLRGIFLYNVFFSFFPLLSKFIQNQYCFTNTATSNV